MVPEPVCANKVRNGPGNANQGFSTASQGSCHEVIGNSLLSTSVNMIVSMVQDILLCLSISINNCCGQCCDGASNMSGSKSGVAMRLNGL